MDPEVGVLSARAADGSSLGCLLNFACHVNTVGGDEVSADYPGQFAAAMKRRRGDGHVGLFANGCCGNLCAIDVYDPERPDSGHDWALQMGEKLAEHVLKIEADMEYQDGRSSMPVSSSSACRCGASRRSYCKWAMDARRPR